MALATYQASGNSHLLADLREIADGGGHRAERDQHEEDREDEEPDLDLFFSFFFFLSCLDSFGIRSSFDRSFLPSGVLDLWRDGDLATSA